MVQAIRAAQEAYRAEAGTYLDVSSSVTTWYPRAIPDAQLHAWNESGHTDFARWQALNPTAPGQGVRMVYVTVAGPPGAPIPALSTNDAIAWPTPTRDWYIVEARGDVDGDGQFSHYAAGSLTPELYFENTD